MKYLIVLAVLFSCNCWTQNLIVSSIDSGGQTLETASVNIIYTIGETNVVEFNNTSTQVSEGFILSFNNDDTLDILNPEIHNISLYPNPTSNFLNINYNGAIELVKVYSTLGQLLVLTADNRRVDVSSLPAAHYIVKIIAEKGSVSKQIIKQ